MKDDQARAELCRLLGLLPGPRRPITARKLREEESDAHVVETLLLDLLSTLFLLLSIGSALGQEAASPLSPAAELATFRLDSRFRIELVACEPEVEDPVAVEWDARGRLWVVEMGDYPARPGGGRVRWLEDRDGDGRYEHSVVFGVGLPFPTSILPHGKGFLVSAAPDILYLEDADGDGWAEAARPVITGFGEGNTQLRVNGLLRGWDGRIYAANGRSGGRVRRAGDPEGQAIDIARHDVRFDPDTYQVEAVSGVSQFGHAFDDWGHRFLSWNTIHIREEVLLPRDLERHPRLLRTATAAAISDHGDSARVYPIAPPPRTFNQEPVDHFNAGCGLAIERGGLFPEDCRGNAFVCEPLLGLVHRDRLQLAGTAWTARRGEEGKEFLASTDPWFHPVNLRSGPDGALYLVDFYRELVEHPDFVRPELRGQIDFTRGRGHGRIYKLYPAGARLFPIADLTGKSSAELVSLLEHPNGFHRDTAQRLLLERRDPQGLEPLRELARRGPALGRGHALWALARLGKLDEKDLQASLQSPEPRLREAAVRVAREEPRLLPRLRQAFLFLMEDADPKVRLAAALALGDLPVEPESAGAAKALAVAARRQAGDPWLETALLSSLKDREVEFLEALFEAGWDAGQAWPEEHREKIHRLGGEAAELVGAARRLEAVQRALQLVEQAYSRGEKVLSFALAASLAQGLARDGEAFEKILAGEGDLAVLAPAWRQVFLMAAQLAGGGEEEGRLRRLAVRTLAHAPMEMGRAVFAALLQPQAALELELEAAQALITPGSDEAAAMLLAAWPAATHQLRQAIIDGLLTRQAGTRRLLAALGDGSLPPAALGASQRERLLKALDASGQERLQKLLRRDNPSRQAVVDRYQRGIEELPRKRAASSHAGAVERGRAIFKEQCAKCHALNGEGRAVGPDLSSTAKKPAAELLVALFDPNRVVEPGYAVYIVRDRKGNVLSGILASETAYAITLRQAEGAEQTLDRRSIREIQATEVSLMPENLEDILEVQAAADLLEFLKNQD
ncbi:MAG: c-type cytochrome [Planctomycetes bacterium]|nr:c-type cytochrome [Planctomycetota bacterium]